MAAVKSAQPVLVAQQHLPSSLQSSPILERSTSTSSSATAHPLDNTTASTTNSGEERASSSTSSSPTYNSNSSSSNHKTISTTVSSTNTNGSLSPTLSNSNQHKASRRSAAAATNTVSIDTANNEYSWDSQDSLSKSTTGNYQRRSSSGQRLMGGHHSDDRWNFGRYRDEDDIYSPLEDEQTPMEYPPVSEEDKEARAIQQNLERWAAEEKQRRKALRTSRTGSMIASNATPGKLTKRLSALNILGTGKSSGDLLGEAGNRNSNILQRETSAGSGHSWGNESKHSERDGSGIESVPELNSGREIQARRSAKGKAREASDPFQDPSTGQSTETEITSNQRQSMKPTARTPIVTPGKAPTIRHRAIEHARKNGKSGRMPSIVATDADEDIEAVRHLQNLVIDPFQSASEMDEQRRQYNASSRTILDGDEGAVTPHGTRAPLRKSFSDSKFNEIGLDNDSNSTVGEEGWDEDHGERGRTSKAEQLPPQQTNSRRNFWWTEWLCGCGNVEDEEGEQSGRTCPEF